MGIYCNNRYDMVFFSASSNMAGKSLSFFWALKWDKKFEHRGFSACHGMIGGQSTETG
jgi:hypothetical protein